MALTTHVTTQYIQFTGSNGYAGFGIGTPVDIKSEITQMPGAKPLFLVATTNDVPWFAVVNSKMIEKNCDHLTLKKHYDRYMCVDCRGHFEIAGREIG